MAEKEAEREARGLSDAQVEGLADKKDAFVKEACRYVSMREGIPPMRALRLVLTWMSGERYGAQITESWLIDQGLPHDGWVLLQFRANRYSDRAQAVVDGSATVTLDEAEEEGHPDIHPAYRRDWYDEVSGFKKASQGHRAPCRSEAVAVAPSAQNEQQTAIGFLRVL